MLPVVAALMMLCVFEVVGVWCCLCLFLMLAVVVVV